MRTATVVFLFLIVPSLAFSATINVPLNQPTIQAGIVAANNGDTVLVAPGTYVENIDFLGKAIKVTSSGGALVTTIDGGSPVNPNLASVVRFMNGEQSTSVLSGFSLRNGSGVGNYGGGIYCDKASPTLINNFIYKNKVVGAGRGAGMFASNCNTIQVINCEFYANSSAYRGGGVAGTDSDFELVNCKFFLNSAGQTGGGIYTFLGDVKAMNCTFTKNSASTGGAISNTNTTTTVTNSVLWDNGSQEIYLNGAVIPVVTYSCVKGGWPGVGNIQDDPLFENPGNGDVHLKWLSPCINRGTNTNAPGDDLDGVLRPHMGTVEMGVYEFTGNHALGADAFVLSESMGGVINLYLFGGAPNGGRTYAMLGSVSGVAPGVPLGPGVVLPLNWDIFTNTVILLLNTPIFSNFASSLSWGSSTALAVFDTQGPLPPGSVGIQISYAYLLYYPLDFVSNPVTIEVIP